MSQNPATKPAPDAVFSPLHRLQANLAKDNEYPFVLDENVARESPLDRDLKEDNESLYSFDSVSTSGRLLDRLDLDTDEYFSEYEASLRRRDSALSFQSIGRLDEDSSRSSFAASNPDLRQLPIRGNSSLGLDRMRSINTGYSAPNHELMRSFPSNSRLPVQAGAGHVTQQKKNRSFDSLHADMAFRQNSSSSLSSANDSALNSRKNSLTRLAQSRSSQRLPAHSPIPESASEFSSPGSSHKAVFTPVTPPKSIESGASMPTTTPLSGTNTGTNGVSGVNVGTNAGNVGSLYAPVSSGRTVSSSSTDSATSLDSTTAFIQSAFFRFDPSIETATRKAVSIRAQGNYREASYQLQTLANAPHNYPKAMLLYAKALKMGQGVKLNQQQSVRWLCRCILTSYIAETSAPESRAFTTYVAKLANVSPETLLDMVKINLSGENLDVFVLTDAFQQLGQPAVNKILQLNTTEKNIAGAAYYELSELLLVGQGVASKDEVTSRLFLAKSAAYAYADAMVKLGELWCSKSKHFKKDFHVASAWYRLGEYFGKSDIGNSWIYKNKYMERKGK